MPPRRASTGPGHKPGTITASVAAVLNLNGSYTTPVNDSIIASAGTVNLYGIMDNTGLVLALDATTGSWNLYGTIQGGTVSTADGTELLVPQGATLDGA